MALIQQDQLSSTKQNATPEPLVNAHTDPGNPPTLSRINGKLAKARIKPGSTDRTHHIEIEVLQGSANDIQAEEVLCRVTFGTPYQGPLVPTIGIPAVPQTTGYEAHRQTLSHYDLRCGGLPGGSGVSVRPLVVSPRGE